MNSLNNFLNIKFVWSFQKLASTTYLHMDKITYFINPN